MPILLTVAGDKRIIGKLEKATKKLSDLTVPLKETGNLLVTEFTDNFPEEGRRLGEPWKKLAASTIKQRIRLGYGPSPILVRTGKLMTGWRQEVTKVLVRISNPVDYFKYHQRGGGHLPQRRMIVVKETLKQQVVAVFADFIRTLKD